MQDKAKHDIITANMIMMINKNIKTKDRPKSTVFYLIKIL